MLKDIKLDLTVKEYELLEYLVLNTEKTISRDDILKRIWNFSYDGDTRIVDVHIFKLRDKLKGSNVSIKTIRGVGYMLGGDVGEKKSD